MSLKLVSLAGDRLIFNVFGEKVHVVTELVSLAGDNLIQCLLREIHVVTDTGLNTGGPPHISEFLERNSPLSLTPVSIPGDNLILTVFREKLNVVTETGLTSG